MLCIPPNYEDYGLRFWINDYDLCILHYQGFKYFVAQMVELVVIVSNIEVSNRISLENAWWFSDIWV